MQDLQTHQGGETGGALGAARLGWLAAGGALAEVCRTPAVAHTFAPHAATHQRLQVRYQQFKGLYPALHGNFPD